KATSNSRRPADNCTRTCPAPFSGSGMLTSGADRIRCSSRRMKRYWPQPDFRLQPEHVAWREVRRHKAPSSRLMTAAGSENMALHGGRDGLEGIHGLHGSRLAAIGGAAAETPGLAPVATGEQT